jgi:hypothetical protein
LIAAEALRLGDEAEQPLRVSARECRHGLQRYDECRMDSTLGQGEPVSQEAKEKGVDTWT